MYCPKCKTEYRDGVSHCSDCGARLVQELPEERTADPVSSGFVTIVRTGDLIEADAIALELERHRIPFFRRVENLSSQEFAMPAFPTPGISTFWIIRVPAGAEDAALAVIQKFPFRPRQGPSMPRHTGRKSYLFAWVPWFVVLLIASMVSAFVYSCFFRA